MHRTFRLVLTFGALVALPALFLTTRAEAQGADVSFSAGGSFLTWSKVYDADGAPQDLGGKVTAFPFGASVGYGLPLNLHADAGIGGVSTTLDPDTGDSLSGAGLREATLSIQRGFGLGQLISAFVLVGGKLDIGKNPDDIDPLTELPTSNGHHGAFGHASLDMSVLESLSARIFGGGVYNLPAGELKREPAPILYGGIGVGGGVEFIDIWWSADLALTYTVAQTSRVDGVTVENSDFSLLHVAPALSATTGIGTFTGRLSAPTEDFEVGFVLTGHNAPVMRAASLSWSHGF